MADAQASAKEKKDYSDLLEAVEKREKILCDKWHKNGKLAWSIYLGDEEGVPFNILFSNTETIVPAVFSRKPSARVTRRFDEARSDVPATIAQRFLTYSMDTNLPSYPSFMTAMEDSVLDAALPGQGLYRVRLVNSLPVLDLVQWDKFVWSYCRRWEDCTWVAFAHDMEPEEILETFDQELSSEEKATFKSKSEEQIAASEKEKTEGQDDTTTKTIRVWEVWDKRKRVRHWLCGSSQNKCLATEQDPLGLENFFPLPPKPLTFVHSTTDTLPRPLYKLYQEQAEELNEITRRLRNIIKAIRVRGVYASGIDDLKKLFEEDDDNVLIPSQAASQIVMTGKGLEAYIWLLPVDKLITVAKELYIAREAIKQTIYEILGIGDILRGVTKASETLGAQELKDKWGSLRINKVRERTAEFIRDGLRLMLEVGLKHTPVEQWMQICGMPQLKPAIFASAVQQMQSDQLRSYLVDVESNSTVDSSATGEKEDTAEFMNAFGQTMAGLKDLMLSSPPGWELGKKILISVASKFQLGQDIQAQLQGLPPPPSAQQPPPELQKAMQEVQKRMQDIAKREEGVKQEEALLKDTDNEIKMASEALKSQEEHLQSQRENFRREQDMVIKEIKLEKDTAILEIKKEGVALATKEASLAAREKAMNNQKKPNQPSGAK